MAKSALEFLHEKEISDYSKNILRPLHTYSDFTIESIMDAFIKEERERVWQSLCLHLSENAFSGDIIIDSDTANDIIFNQNN
jgi:hypothetical protein